LATKKGKKKKKKNRGPEFLFWGVGEGRKGGGFGFFFLPMGPRRRTGMEKLNPGKSTIAKRAVIRLEGAKVLMKGHGGAKDQS